MVLPRASLKRSARTRTRKNTLFAETDVEGSSPPSSPVRQKTRPPPLQIISELSESELAIDGTHSPVTARPMHFILQPPEPVSSRVTLSAYAFSIDDALLMFGNDTPGSPTLSASSSTSDGASSEDVPATPATSDDDNRYDFVLPTPRFRSQRISIRPLCITKTRSLICHGDEDLLNYFEQEKKAAPLPEEYTIEAFAAADAVEEADGEFYCREFEDFITLFPIMPSLAAPARRDSLVFVNEPSPVVVDAPVSKPRGRSRHSKPLPLLPPPTPPISTFRSILNAPLAQTAAPKSVVRRKRNIISRLNHAFPPRVGSRLLPQMDVPQDVEDCIFAGEVLDISSRGSIISEEADVCSRSSFPPAISETPLSGMYDEFALPRLSTDSDAPRSSTDSTSSLTLSVSSPLSLPSSPSSEECLRSRWSTSTLGSFVVEPPRSTTLLSPLRNVLGSRARRILPVPPKMPSHLSSSKHPKVKYGLSAMPLPPRASGKHVRQRDSQSSTSSAETSPSERDSRDGSPSGLKRKPIPVAMFLRST